MRKKNYIPPVVIPRVLQKISGMLRYKIIREIILLPSTLTGRRFSNKTEDYGVFKPSLVSHLEQLSLYVKNIEETRKWYEDLAGMSHSRTCEKEPHPYKEGFMIRCCYMNTIDQEECLVLIEEYDKNGNILVPSGMSLFHFAFELEGNTLEDVFEFAQQCKESGFDKSYGVVRHNDTPPIGDGETGGNVAVYYYDPNYTNVEFFAAMDTIENYRDR